MKRKSYFTILLLILAIGIGYATLSTTLSITGLSKFKKNTWDIHFENITDNSFNTAENVPATILGNKKSIEYEVSLNNPGESYAFYTDVVNDGTIDAMFDNLKVEGLSDKLQKVVEVKVTYLDGIELTKYDLLKVNSRETIKVETKFKDSENLEISDLPDEDMDFTLTLTINYLQSDENAKVRENGESDEVAPILANLNTTIEADNISVNISSYDQFSGIAKYYFSKDGGENYIESTNPNYTFTSLADGDYDIKAYVADVSGNTSVPMSSTVPLYAIYATLYDDGTLVLNSTGNIDSEKTVSASYGNITKSTYSEETIPWYQNRENITMVDIENTIKPLCTAYWFYWNRNLTKILNMENLKMSNVTDVSRMFFWDDSLTELDVSSWDTSNVVNMSDLFLGATSLTSLDVSNFNTSKVTDMSGMFSGNWQNSMQLTEIKGIEDFDTSNVTDMSRMFDCTSGLTTLDLSKWNTSKVTKMTQIFNQSSGLSSLNVSTWDTSNVTDMEGMFQGPSNITSLDISNFDTSKVTTMQAMFAFCSNLQTIDLSNFDTSKVTNMSHMFSGASGLTSLDLSNFDTSKVTNMAYMFNSLSNLTSLDLSNFNTSKVTDMSWMFGWDFKLEGLDLSNWDTRKVSSFNSTFNGTSRDATSKILYYGPNSINLYEARNNTPSLYMEFTYKNN